ncbi:hypothetical protein MYU51_014291 [Penicillium brevicompactum]|uniref:Bromodomain n=1 Tax=Penicillium brevicompactum TaxID=5074 RepID=UPI0025412FB1|nr:Bromodomain [Penicillium brevicompactum]KAJ5333283.1 Bromodomain [Penicillium brevicompactum]
MSSKRRSAAAASPDVRSRAKRQKVSDDDIDETSSRVSSHIESEDDEDPESQDYSEVDFEGDSLQSAQDKIMSELTKLQDDDGQEVAYPFIGKPDRTLYRDYYELIQHPVSLRSIQKKVRGTDSRKNTSKTTAYPTWQSFEEEVSYIWRNAREYNEDDSEISALAGILENYFWNRVAEAKKLVPNPQVDGTLEMPRIKLKMGASVPPITGRLTLKMPAQGSETISQTNGQRSNTLANREPSDSQPEAPGGSASQNVSTSPPARSLRNLNSPGASVGTTATSDQPFLGARGLSSVVKAETPMSISTPQAPARAALGTSADSARQFSPPNTLSYQYPGPSPMDCVLRQSGQDASMALIRNVQIATHTSLSLQPDFCLDIPPSSLVSQQSLMIHLPSSHNLLTLKPRLAASTGQRQVKIVALTGMQRLQPSGDSSTPVYDIRLHPGMTKVDLEAIAGPARGVPRAGPPGADVQYERVTVFFNLLH